ASRSWLRVPAIAALIVGIGLGWWVGPRIMSERPAAQLPAALPVPTLRLDADVEAFSRHPGIHLP
ncbi:MAG TPA: hypothetical protein VFF82_01255, partial [Rhodocyclaceae bacterium]|nr:hypothetical protein [Rhodocyclaceae bacterium]